MDRHLPDGAAWFLGIIEEEIMDEVRQEEAAIAWVDDQMALARTSPFKVVENICHLTGPDDADGHESLLAYLIGHIARGQQVSQGMLVDFLGLLSEEATND